MKQIVIWQKNAIGLLGYIVLPALLTIWLFGHGNGAYGGVILLSGHQRTSAAYGRPGIFSQARDNSLRLVALGGGQPRLASMIPPELNPVGEMNQTSSVEAYNAETNPWSNVRAYGARGDGVSDDTEAIQRGLNGTAALGGFSFSRPGGT